MLFKQFLALAAWSTLPFTASAQQSQHPSVDGNAPTAAVGYESSFKNFRSSGAESTAPDKVWRGANDEMAKLGGHAGHMKDNGSRLSPASGPEAAIHGHGTTMGHHH